jgi:hypothetical protein
MSYPSASLVCTPGFFDGISGIWRDGLVINKIGSCIQYQLALRRWLQVQSARLFPPTLMGFFLLSILQ